MRCVDDENTSSINNEHLYTGRRTDPETGLQLNRYRYYHQQLGRWVNRDPIEYEGKSTNLYEYVGGRPSIAVDPSGLIWPQPLVYPLPVPPKHTPDEQDLIGFCQGDPNCEKEMEEFIDKLDDIDLEESPDGVGPCYEYVQGCKNQCPKDPPGDCTVKYYEGKPKPFLTDEQGRKPTWYNIFGHPVRWYSEHSWGQICCPQDDGSTKCMNFDVGSDSKNGQFGGPDHLFPPNDPDFRYEIDPPTINPIR